MLPDEDELCVAPEAIRYHVSRQGAAVIVRKQYPAALGWSPDHVRDYGRLTGDELARLGYARAADYADAVCRKLMTDAHSCERFCCRTRIDYELLQGVNAWEQKAKVLEVPVARECTVPTRRLTKNGPTGT